MLRFTLVFCSLVLCSPVCSLASVIEQGNLNIIDNALNPQDGWGLFDLDWFFNLDAAAALTKAQGVNTNARFANPTELDPFFNELGVDYGARSLAEGWSTGVSTSFDPVSGQNADAGILINATTRFADFNVVHFWTDPDGSAANSSTYDVIQLTGDGPVHLQQFGVDLPPHLTRGFVIVVPTSTSAVPEPASWFLLGLTCAAGCVFMKLRSRAGQANATNRL